MPVAVRYEGARDPTPSCDTVERWAERMLRALALPDAELSVLLCDDLVIQQLNHRYRQLDQPTDVLAFAMSEGRSAVPGELQLLGDVVISLETAGEQALEAGHPIAREVVMLLAHGLLHLLGQDHQTPADERRMRARTDLLVAAAAD